MHPQYALRLDGSKLPLEENGKPIISWARSFGQAGPATPALARSRLAPKLMLEENGKAIMDGPAVSGRRGTQGAEYQSYRDHGPLPQGDYHVNVGEMQRYEDTSLYDRFKGAFKHGTWKGGTPAWGRYRFWLKPGANTQTFG